MNSSRAGTKSSVWLITAYLFFEYVRPQTFIPGLNALHIPMLVQIAIILTLLRSNFENLKSKESLLFLLLVCLMAFHIPFAVNNYWAYQTTRNMFLQFVVFLGIVGFLRTYEDFDRVLTFWLVIAVLCAAKGYFEGGMIPGSAFLGDENDFALFLNMMLPLAFFKGSTASSRRQKLFYYAGMVILILGTVASKSRGGFVGLLPPLLYCWWKSPGKIKTAIISAVMALFLVTYVIPQSYWDRMQTIRTEGAKEGTGAERVYLWKNGWAMFRSHPLVGIGPGNFAWNIADYEPAEGFAGRSHAGQVAHSIYFTLLPELGLAGAFLFFGLIWVNRREVSRIGKLTRATRANFGINDGEHWEKIKNLEARGWAFTGAMLAYLISGAFLAALYYGHFWLIMGFSVARNNMTKELLLKVEAEPENAIDDDIDENCGDRWEYARRARNYSVPR